MKISVLSFAVSALVLLSATASAKNVLCYFASWTVYRPGNGKFDVPDIDPTLCTHILFGFVGLSWDGKVQILDGWESNDDGLQGFQHLVNLKQTRPDLKILVSMGGWNEGSAKYSQLAEDPAKRKILAQDVLSFIEEHNFDGFDLDWEYPGIRDGSDPEKDPANFVALLKDLRDVLNPKGYILTAAVSGGITNMDIAYDIPAVAEQLDLISVMVYDFHGAFEDFVGHYAPLYKSHLDTTEEQQSFNVAGGIQHWIEKGAPPSKLMLGIGTYGRSFTLADPENTQLYAPVIGGGTAGPYTRQDGVLGYNEICELHSDWTYVWDSEQMVPHRISGNQWVGYDDMQSVKLKVEFANSLNLGGVMVWAFDTDDFRGLCGDGTYPLLRTINRTLK